MRDWSGGATDLGNRSVPGRPINLHSSKTRAYCACCMCGRGLFGHFGLSSINSLFLLPLFVRRLDIDLHTVSKGR